MSLRKKDSADTVLDPRDLAKVDGPDRNVGRSKVNVKPLDGIRVLDFGRYIAGPFCAAMLADLGAEVIRIERPSGGEDRYIYPVTEEGEGALFLQMNRNKWAMTLDPKSEGGREVLARLLATADVVVANLPASTLRELRLDYASLMAIRPDIVLTAISAFGTGGPYSDRVGFDSIGQAMSGATWLSGQPDAPMKNFASWVDYTTALFASNATLGALITRGRTGKGAKIEANLFASALTVMNFPIMEQAILENGRTAAGNRAQSGGPADAVPTKDGWIVVHVVGDALFRRWTRLIDEPHWLDDPRFATDALRSDNGEILTLRTAEWSAGLTMQEALAALAAARIPAGPILSPQGVIDDPHVVATEMFTAMQYPGLAAAVPIMMASSTVDGDPAQLYHPAPRLGEHTDAILQSLGYSESEIAALRDSGSI